MLLIAWSSIYAHPLPEGHRFPMEKYNLIPEQLLYEGTITAANLFEPQAVAEADILLTHDADYWARLKGHVPGPAGQFRGDFHRGPHVRVIARHMRWPLNKIVSEAEYDAAAVSAYAVRLGENIAEQDAALKAANARAGQTISIADDGEEVTS